VQGSSPYATYDTPLIYCDGFDGEILMGDSFLKLDTGQRDVNDRSIRVAISAVEASGGQPDCSATIDPAQGDLDLSGNVALDAFFGWRQDEYVSSERCAEGQPTDPFDGAVEFDEASLQCLDNSGERRNLTQLLPGDGTVYQAWEMRLSEPGVSLKKGIALDFAYGGVRGPFACDVETGEGLPVAIRCTGEGDDPDNPGAKRCEAWAVKTFRACVADYNPTRGGNYQQAYTGCSMPTDITFTRKP
jgi:hypothetical protein